MFLGTIELGRKIMVESTCCGDTGRGEINLLVAANHPICWFVGKEEVAKARRVQLYGGLAMNATSDDFSFDRTLFRRAISELSR